MKTFPAKVLHKGTVGAPVNKAVRDAVENELNHPYPRMS